MSSVGDSTLEALSLHYVGIGLSSVVNNVWTLLALFTAALSFWRLRGANLLLLLHLPGHRRRRRERGSCSEAVDSSSEAATVPARNVDSETGASPPECGDGATKGKFVAYYREDEERDVAVAAAVEEEEIGDRSGDGGGCEAGEWWEGWEKAWRMRRKGAEKGTGWYDGLDVAVLNGSVVRLWAEGEEERGRTGVCTSSMASPHWQSMRCVLW